MNKQIAKDLVECGYAETYSYYSGDDIAIVHGGEGKFASQLANPFKTTREGCMQLHALAFYHLFPDDELTLTGDGHFDVYEQLVNFVKIKYSSE